MHRRTLLTTIPAIGLAGCTGRVPGLGGSDDGTVLGPPEQRRGTPSHPIHGEAFPAFEVPDPLAKETVSLEDLTDRGPFMLTFIFTSCQGRCGELVGLFSLAQADAQAEGWANEMTLAAMTFDPKRDDVDALMAYCEAHGFDVTPDHARLLRPKTGDDAMDIVVDTFGVPAHHGHDDHDNGHETPGEATHYYMLFIVNADGIVERSYPAQVLFEPAPNDIIDDFRTVVT